MIYASCFFLHSTTKGFYNTPASNPMRHFALNEKDARMNPTSRRTFLKAALSTAAVIPWGAPAAELRTPTARRPNIVLVLTDDQGYGDMGCHGNPDIKTPNVDRLHAQSIRFTRFHASPVCSPTRSSLMTGRYNYRTGVVDTYQGRSMMHPEEVTLAEALAAQAYRTGIFGKWHLGDNYPLRAMDQGFQECLVHKGGGLCQPSEPRNNSYFDPLLKHNGEDVQGKGYCSDIFTQAALDYIEKNAANPFFVYLAFNAPHDPLIVEDRYSAPYLAKGLPEKTAKFYGMIANMDENVGKVLDALERLKLTENTIVIFMTDNGSAIPEGVNRFNAGMRGKKGSVYEGGIRVPYFIRWPERFTKPQDVDRIAAHIDLFPTLLAACGVPVPAGVQLDGTSLLPLMENPARGWPDRTLFFQWHRGDEPKPYTNCAVLTQKYKLVDGKELYDLEQDPGEEKDIAAEHPDIVTFLRERYDVWFREVGAARGYAPPRIHLGTPHENPVTLTRQDWRGAESWHDGNAGYWEVHVANDGAYEITAEFPASDTPRETCFRLNGVELKGNLPANTLLWKLNLETLPSGNGRLEVKAASTGPQWVTVRKKN